MILNQTKCNINSVKSYCLNMNRDLLPGSLCLVPERKNVKMFKQVCNNNWTLKKQKNYQLLLIVFIFVLEVLTVPKLE